MNKKYARHELSAACGDQSPEEFIALQVSIAARGVLEPIKIFQGKVLDGFHRYNVATALGLPCPEEQFEGDYDAAADYVWDRHGTRRNWDESQRGWAMVKLNDARTAGRPNNSAPGAGLPPTDRDLADRANVSQRTIQQAKRVERNAIPEVGKAIEDGDISLKRAEKIASLPKDEQKAALTEPKTAPKPREKKERWEAITPPAVGASVAALDELKERNAILSEELDRVNDRLAVIATNGETTDEERLMYSATLEELRAEVRTVTAELKATRSQRDGLMVERNELITQCKQYRNQLQKYQSR